MPLMPFAPRPPGSARPRLRAVSVLLLGILAVGTLDGCSKLKKVGSKVAHLGRHKVKYTPGTAEKVLNVPMSQLMPAIAARIGSADRPAWVTPARWTEVKALYTRFGNAPLWLEEGGMKDRAKALLTALHEAPEHALDTTAYPISEIERVASEKRITDSSSVNSIADADVLLTAAYVAYAADMLAGQVDPKSISQAWHIGTNKTELDSALVRSLEDSDMTASLREMAPQDQDYAALKVAYARYRDIAAKGGWPEVPAAKGPARDAALHARLDAELAADSIGFVAAAGDSSAPSQVPVPSGDSAPAPVPSARSAPHGTSAALVAELKNFQERHGLERTGVLDKRTVAAINTPADARARQIAANLERHRWLPRTLGSRYVYVNVPAFRLDAYDGGQKTLTMRVVVGAEYEGRTTPVFSDSMESVVFRPYWNITPDIQRLEIAPKGEAYMAANNMEYYKDGGETRIRQRPGGKNSLGLVKFLFPNSFNIYLHDTPAKSLFQQTDRAASHGCIRLEKPAELAQWALGWDGARVQNAMENGSDNNAVRVSPKIPVYIVYFTSYVRDGRIYFGDDVYGRDDALLQKVARLGVHQPAVMQAGAPER
ncbi:MAG: ErfK/YbiS/YcfS/YnhG family protein [Gemmatimonadetes bacterium]|jgi:murein L,D-transpeptidase YcbB/YkuD|nr:ErfK/YbiS/YcfS/YnhG family protein [Gemmatimonadota bacterium]